MSEYLIYGSEHYAVLRQGPGVLVRQLATNATEWLQGDDADQLEAELDIAADAAHYGPEYEDLTEAQVTEFTDHNLSQYFGRD